MNPSLEQMVSEGQLRALDRHFAEFIGRLAGSDNPELLLAAALVSRATGEGNTCFPLREPELLGWADKIPLPPHSPWEALLRAAPAADIIGCPGEKKPLILDEKGRLYLYRYWKYEFDLAGVLRAKACPLEHPAFPPGLKDRLNDLFPASSAQGGDRQRLAAFIALRNRLVVISGGPGTGKTHTLARILGLLAAGQDSLKIRLAAPTGKAAARVEESILAARSQLEFDHELMNCIPIKASTIHRLLGFKPRSTQFYHNQDNPLRADVVIIDEASMVDLPLMAKLVLALEEKTRLILLGDMDQLASVEPGYVLGDICAAGNIDTFSQNILTDYHLATGLDLEDPGIATSPARAFQDCLVRLNFSHRFDPEGKLAQISQTLLMAQEIPEAQKAWDILVKQDEQDELSYHQVPMFFRSPSGRIDPEFARRIKKGYREYIEAPDLPRAFRALKKFKVLTAHRRGLGGVEKLNELIEEVLGFKPSGQAGCYDKKVIMVTRNDHGMGLYNGDIGIIVKKPGSVRAFFEPGDGSENYREIPLGLLPEYETAFALTVHKAQGSEFEQILFILPPKSSPLLTKELIYTGLTRARSQVEIWCSEKVFLSAVLQPVQRSSGLLDALIPTVRSG